jgi:hypothetical protein
VLGINFGRVGFLTTADGSELEAALTRALAGELRVVDLCTLEAAFGAETHPAVNDVVVTSSRPGRMVELGWQVAGEDLGDQPCDGMICCTPSGSTAYNLSNGGPVLMWGLDAMAMTFVAPHSLRARALVVPRGLDLRVTEPLRRSWVTVSSTGTVGELERRRRSAVRSADHRRLAVRPEGDILHAATEVFLSVPKLVPSTRIESFVLIREADLAFASGLNAVTGETGAGKTILAQAVGLLLGAPGDAAYLGPEAEEAYVEAELDLPEGILDEPGLEAVAELRPAGEEGLAAARRVFATGAARTRGAPVPGRSPALAERLLAMSGQFSSVASRPRPLTSPTRSPGGLRGAGRAPRTESSVPDAAMTSRGAAAPRRARQSWCPDRGDRAGRRERLLAERASRADVTELAEAAVGVEADPSTPTAGAAARTAEAVGARHRPVAPELA